MSNTQERRKEKDYRKLYFEKYTGLPVKGKYICPICYKLYSADELEIDHIIPLAKYGVNQLYNCCALCKSCNREKADKIEISYIIKEFSLKLVEDIFRLVKWIFRLVLDLIIVIIKYPFSFSNSKRNNIIIAITLIVILVILLNEIGG